MNGPSSSIRASNCSRLTSAGSWVPERASPLAIRNKVRRSWALSSTSGLGNMVASWGSVSRLFSTAITRQVPRRRAVALPPPSTATIALSPQLSASSLGGVDMQTAEEQDRDENDQNQAEGAAQSSPAISAVSIVSASAADQQDQDDNDEDRSHFPPRLPREH